MKRAAGAALAGFLLGCLPLWVHPGHELGAILELFPRLLSLLLNLPGFVLVAGYSLDGWHTVPGHALAALLSYGFYALAIKTRPPRLAGAPRGVTRRQVLQGAAVGGLTVICYGWGVERLSLTPTVRKLPLKGLPPELEGLRVGLMSDLHCGPFNSQSYLREAVLKMNELHPDLVLLPGDFVSRSKVYFPRAAELVSLLKPRISGGLLGTLGNHDHWHGLEEARTQLPAAGLTLIENQHLILTPGRELADSGSRGLCLAGVGDLWEDKPDLHEALKGVPAEMPRLVLCHNPDVAELQAQGAPRVDLMLSGHTHGGQISVPGLGPPILPSNFGQKYASGLIQGPSFPVYVNRGVGVGGIPLRVGVPPEIVLFELTQA